MRRNLVLFIALVVAIAAFAVSVFAPSVRQGAIPPIPSDFGQLSQWLIMPGVLIFFANLVINDFFSQDTDQQKNVIKFVVFLVDALVSYALTRLAPDFVASIQPLWAILAAVIAVYYAPTVVTQVWFGLKLLGLRLLLSRAAFEQEFTQLMAEKADEKLAAQTPKPIRFRNPSLEPHG